MKKVRFPMYFEVAGYQTVVLPDFVDAKDGDAVRAYIDENWEHIKLPDDYEYVDGSCEFDFESPIKVEDEESGEEWWM